MKIYDISLPLEGETRNWPGDVAYRLRPTLRIAGGDTVNVGAVAMSLHSATHADAPYHFLEDGLTIDQLDPSIFMGPATVLELRDVPEMRITHFDLATLQPRVLVKTMGWADRSSFPRQIPVMSGDVPAFLKLRGVILFGLDLPSVDRIESKELPNHHALAREGIQILESLQLDQVVPGEYDLFALPLKVIGGDAAPVRAVLRTRE